MKIPSGSTDRKIFFVAVDATDLKTRETGITVGNFSCYRSRNGGTATIYTTPTFAELSAANMPGVYSLLIDEDTTLGAGNDSEEYCIHIKDSGGVMAPVTRVLEIYRPETTEGNTLDVTSTGAGGVDWGNVENKTTTHDFSNTTIGVVTLNSDMRGTDSASTHDALAVWHVAAASVVTASTIGLQLKTNVDAVLSNIEGDTQDIQTRLPAALVAGRIDASVGAMAADTITSGALAASAVNEIIDQAWDETMSEHLAAGSTGAALNAAGGAGDPWITTLPGSYTSGQAGKIVGDALASHIAQTGDSFARIGAAGVGLTNISLPASGLDLILKSSTFALAMADAVWDEPLAAHVGADSAGLVLNDWQDGGRLDVILDATALEATVAGLNDIAAADVWAAGTRTLTAATGITSDGSTITMSSAGVVGTVNLVNTTSALTDKLGFALSSNGVDLISIDGRTLVSAISIIAASTAGELSGAGSGTETVKGLDNATTRLVATIDGSGNRTTMVYS